MTLNKAVKLFFRKIIFPVIYFLRLNKFLVNTKKHNRLIIAYHGVIEKENLKYNGRHFSKYIFEKQLNYYKKHFSVIPLSEIFDMYRQNIIPPKPTIAITFDDGFENNYSVAFPILRKYNLPATFFVSAVCVENNNAVLWAETIDILKQDVGKIDINGITFVKDGRYNFSNIEKKITISDYIKKLNAHDRDIIIDDINSKYCINKKLEKIDPQLWKLMNIKQIQEIAQSNLFEIASHGYLHYNLANLTKEEAYNDLKKSKEILETVIDRKLLSVAFPDSSYNKTVKDTAILLGFKNMCAVTYQNNSDKNDKSILPRYGLSATTNYYSNIFFLHKAFEKLGF